MARSGARTQANAQSHAVAPSSAKAQDPSVSAAHGVSERLATGGRPLPPTTRERLERSFGQSLGDVRVHEGAPAAEVTHTHKAEALTVGRDVAFAPGRYQPGTETGEKLIAHEVAHVLQQRGGVSPRAQARALYSASHEPAEREADRAAETAASGGVAHVSASHAPTTRQRIMRKAVAGAASAPSLSIATPANPTKAASERSAASAGVPGAAPAPSAALGMAPAAAQAADGKLGAPKLALDSAGAAAKDGEKGSEAKKKEDAGPRKAATEDKKSGKKEAENKKKEEAAGAGEKDAAAGGAGGAAAGARPRMGSRARRFGVIPGDRGAKAAERAAKRLEKLAKAKKTHEPAAKKVKDARAAVEVPPKEGEARSESKVVAQVGGTRAPEPKPEDTKQKTHDAVTAATPATLEDLDAFSGSGKTNAIKAVVSANVGGQVKGVKDTYAKVQEPGAPEPAPAAVKLPEPEKAPGAAAPKLAEGVPPPMPEQAADGSEFKEEGNAAVEEGGLDQETLDKAEDGPVKAIAGEKKKLDDSAESATNEAKTAEGAALGQAQAELDSEEQTAKGELNAHRKHAQAKVLTKQGEAKQGEEKERLSVAEQMEGIYEKAAGTVQTTLDGLVDGAAKRFDEAQAQYLEDFKNNTERDLDAFKSDRYSGWTGWAKWLKDKVVSINELAPVKALYERNRNEYIQRIDKLIEQISADTQKTIDDCKKTLNDAQAEISRMAEALGKKLPADAKAKQKELAGRFAQLEEEIDRKAQEVKDSLAEKRKGAIKAVDDALAEIKAKNEALLDKVKKLVKFLVDLVGKFLTLMKRIIKLGVGRFLKSLMSQAWDGIKNHLWGALKVAFNEWLEAKLEPIKAMMNLPPDFMEALKKIGSSLVSLARQVIPAMLPALGLAFGLWLGGQLIKKLIPGAGAIMVVIDGLKAAWGLIQSIFSAAEPFFGFIMGVADPRDVPGLFATALAQGLIAGMEGIIVFLGVDKLLRKVIGVIGKPLKGLFEKLKAKFGKKSAGKAHHREHDRKKARDKEHEEHKKKAAHEDDPHAKKTQQDAADHEKHAQKKQDELDQKKRHDEDEKRKKKQAEEDEHEQGKKKGEDPDEAQTKKEKKQDDDEKKKDDSEANARKRLEIAASKIRAELRDDEALSEAQSEAAGVASAQRVSASVVDAGEMWLVTLTANPRKVVMAPKGTKKGDEQRYKRYVARCALEKRVPLSKKEWLKVSRGGRGGGPEHEAVREKIRSEGLRKGHAVSVEEQVAESGRFADVMTVRGKKPTYHQIGGTNPVRGDPIARERAAITDMVKAMKKTGKKADIIFWDKKTGIPIKNPHLLWPDLFDID